MNHLAHGSPGPRLVRSVHLRRLLTPAACAIPRRRRRKKIGMEKHYEEMTEEERQACTDLGWSSAEMWDNHEHCHECHDAFFAELTPQQQRAATVLGYTEDLWNNPAHDEEDEDTEEEEVQEDGIDVDVDVPGAPAGTPGRESSRQKRSVFAA